MKNVQCYEQQTSHLLTSPALHFLIGPKQSWPISERPSKMALSSVSQTYAPLARPEMNILLEWDDDGSDLEQIRERITQGYFIEMSDEIH